MSVYKRPAPSLLTNPLPDSEASQSTSAPNKDERQRSVVASVVAPVSLPQDSVGFFEIAIENVSDQIATDIIVQVTVPENFAVTEVYREAWMDGELRTVSWKIDTLEVGQKEIIRYEAVSRLLGSHEQTISVGVNNIYQGDTRFKVNVVRSNLN